MTIAKPTASESGTNSARPAPCMKNDGMKTARTQSIARSRGTAVCWLPRRTDRATERVRSIWWWMFSTSTVDSSTRMPMASASPPRVMMLIVWPVSQRPTRAPQRANGMFSTTTITLRQSRRNRRTISPVRAAPISALGHHGPHRPGDRRRLVQLEADLDVVGQDGLHARDGLLDVVHHRQRRGVGPLRDQDVDGAAAVGQRVAGGDVAGVVDGADVADVDGGLLPGPDRDVLQVLDLLDQRVDRDDRHLVADPDGARGADRSCRRSGR